jgi:YfiH family protein
LLSASDFLAGSVVTVLNNNDNSQPGPSKNDGPGFLQVESLNSPGLAHAFFTRHGGGSEHPYSSLNCSFGVGDRRSVVMENRRRMKESLGIDHLVSAHQIHGDKVMILQEMPKDDFEADGFDAFVTDQPIGLMIQQADCQAVIFYDPVRKVIGAAHVGWRGSVAGMIGETVRAMIDNFGSEPADLLAAVSPSLGPCCAEFVNYRSELPEWMHSFQVRSDHFDFWEISRIQLQEAGVAASKIDIARVCTCCSKDHFSYRRSKTTGRCATVIGLVGDQEPS